MDYAGTTQFLQEVEAVGYIFDYGLDNEPYGLRPIGVELNEVEGFEDADGINEEKFADGGGFRLHYMGHKGERFVIQSQGKGHWLQYLLIKANGNNDMVDMYFSSPEEAKKYADKRELIVVDKFEEPKDA